MTVNILVAIIVGVLCSEVAGHVTSNAHLREFIRTVPLQSYKGHFFTGSSNTTDHQKQGFVDSGSLVSFTDKLTGQNKEDVLNGALFSSLAADYMYNREQQTDQWYEYYGNVMEKMGWVIQNFTFQHYNPGEGTFTIDKVAIDLLAAIASDEEVVVAKEVLNAMKSLETSDGRVVLFEQRSYSNEAGNFQIMPCNVDDSGQLVMRMAAFYFGARKDETRFLFIEWDSNDIDIYTSSQTITLDMDVYNIVRDEVIKRLGDQAKQNIDNIPIA